MSGPIRQQLGPRRKRLTDQVIEAQALCKEELTDEILEHLLKISRNCWAELQKTLILIKAYTYSLCS